MKIAGVIKKKKQKDISHARNTSRGQLSLLHDRGFDIKPKNLKKFALLYTTNQVD